MVNNEIYFIGCKCIPYIRNLLFRNKVLFCFLNGSHRRDQSYIYIYIEEYLRIIVSSCLYNTLRPSAVLTQP